MTNKTLTRADLMHAVYVNGPGLSRNEAKEIVEATIAEICMSLENGEVVKLRGFGTFTINRRAPRMGRKQVRNIPSRRAA